MPKSKRDKKISLTKVEKKVGLETKQKLVDNVRNCVDTYARIFVFKTENMRNNKLKDVREKWSHSKFFIGKNRVVAKALGKTEEEEYNENLHKVSTLLRGECGLLFTNEKTEDVLEWFEGLAHPDYARTGGVCSETVVLPEGPLPEFSHAIEPQLRLLGLPTALKKGIVTLIQEHTVCKKGDILTSEQARILKLLGKEQAEFRLRMLAVWANDGSFKILAELPETDENSMDEEGEDEDVDDE
ncbi:mRNA turnover protein 4 homolog [Eurytemora carolleeae]|uniref:mRNA turnover protein 4 homolog n=1 Tax=Eurytemora carolleeae TaxID=1294199 RepID=UPI000C776BDE|nr:mRNA turnover protein 4 homolog [Eurytemora carolleeae]|eukprot:XP_023325449.1 mRNA turnover protein 4 homolog [Eurytemora affinis]